MIALLLASSVPLPVDVRRFVARHESCEHWLGEDGYDAARAREIARAVRTHCAGIDRARARLLLRYRDPSPARKRLFALPPLED